MTDEVAATEVADESQETEGAETPEAPATPAFDEATWKKRLAGKDQALTTAQKERDALKAQLAELSKWKAEKEQADLSEVERLQLQIQNLEKERETAVREAKAVRLAKEYPLAVDLLGDQATSFDEARLAEINARLAQEAEDESAPRVDPNTPRRNPPRPKSERTVDDILDDLRKEAVPVGYR